MKIKLLAKDGSLYTPHSAIVQADLKEYFRPKGSFDDPDGDVILANYDATAHWPLVAQTVGETVIRTEAQVRQNLAACLYDARETGVIPADTYVVELPDGTEFRIDYELEGYEQRDWHPSDLHSDGAP